jgi:hypothetical protein
MKILTFKAALKQAEGRRHLLLGNGFSRACRNDIFSYSSLFSRADFKGLSPNARKAFDILGTTNFEAVMSALRNAAKLIALYDKANKAINDLEKDADGLREVLVSAIAGNHPARPGEIGDKQYAACRRFLSNFQSFYTVNYDLLLYWALMHEDEDSSDVKVKADDGFRTPETGEEEYVTWDVENTNRQNVHYLHGALHVFDAGSEIQKYTWINTGVRLIDQIRAALKRNFYPLFVAEGESRQKLEQIQHSGYLNRAFRSFANIGGNLFIFGHSMSDSDDHILNLLTKNNVEAVYVSLHGKADTAANKMIIEKIRSLSSARKRESFAIYLFDASSAKVWG